ncbi:MAG: DEAD/DEAH box helicase, partial [Thermoanaerobaculia bacterium]|nr:DEAD/DEAH box helicase [Thermoanaerobaculia bacterium]
DIDLRELLDPDVIFEHERKLQRLEPRARADSPDALHDLLLYLGDLSRAEIEVRTNAGAPLESLLDQVLHQRRAVEVRIAGEERLIPVEYVSRYRDALGVPAPPGVPERLLESTDDPLGDLALRYSRTHAPFRPADLAERFGLGPQVAKQTLERLTAEGRLVEGELTPMSSGREFCHRDVLGTLRHRSLARLRQEVEPVEPDALGRFSVGWQGIVRRTGGLNALLDAVEQLQGSPLPASVLESEILPARIADYSPSDLDTLAAAGEVVWIGLEPLGSSDGRIALYLTDNVGALHDRVATDPDGDERAIIDLLRSRGAVHFDEMVNVVGGFPNDTLERLWDLVWKGQVTNDSFHPLRSWMRRGERSRRRGRGAASFRSRRAIPPGAEGRWTIVPESRVGVTERATTLANQLLDRYGIVTREIAALEKLPGGFSSIYPVLRSMEDAGRVRRGYFVEGVAATQFARPGAIDRLRASRGAEPEPSVVVISAVDPANPYGILLPWGESPEGKRPSRSAGARVIIVDGRLGAYLYRGFRAILSYLPEDEPERSRVARGIALGLTRLLRDSRRRAVLVESIDAEDPTRHFLYRFLTEAGFVQTVNGLQLRQESLDA